MSIRVLGDFVTLEDKLARGLITQDEYQKVFEKTRKHGFDGSIYPFAVGGSDAPIIMGVSPYKSPLRLYHEKFGKSFGKISTKQKEIFSVGHLFEPVFRDLFSLRSGFDAQPCTLQIVNNKYPHCVANIDGLVYDKSGKPFAIYEGKTTRYYTKVAEAFLSGTVPIYYEMQCQFYMEIWNLDTCYINCGWGLADNEMHWIEIKRNKLLGEEICKACETFVVNAKRGIAPDNRNVSDPMVIANDFESLHGASINSAKPVVKLPNSYKPSFEQLDRLFKKKCQIEDDLRPLKAQECELREKMKPIEKILTEIEKEEQVILNSLRIEMKDSLSGVFEDSDATYKVQIAAEAKYSLDAEVKAYWKETYPDCFRDVTTIKPHPRTISYEKITKKTS